MKDWASATQYGELLNDSVNSEALEILWKIIGRLPKLPRKTSTWLSKTQSSAFGRRPRSRQNRTPDFKLGHYGSLSCSSCQNWSDWRSMIRNRRLERSPIDEFMDPGECAWLKPGRNILDHYGSSPYRRSDYLGGTACTSNRQKCSMVAISIGLFWAPCFDCSLCAQLERSQESYRNKRVRKGF